MNFFSQISHGFSIGFQCVGYIVRYPTLLALTAIPTLLNTFFMLALLNTVLRYTNIITVMQETHNHPNTMLTIHGHFSYSFFSLIILFFIVRIFISFFNAALQQYIKDLFDNNSPSLARGLSTAFSHGFSLMIWGIISVLTNMFIKVLRRGNSQKPSIPNITTHIVAATFGAIWSVATFFVVPFIIFGNQNVFSAIYSSYETVKNNFGKNFGIQLSLLTVYKALNLIMVLLLLPCASLVYYVSHNSTMLSDASIYNYVMLIGACVAIPNLLIFPIKHALKNICAVVLYNYLHNKNTGPFTSLLVDNK